MYEVKLIQNNAKVCPDIEKGRHFLFQIEKNHLTHFSANQKKTIVVQ